jgi:RNA polymerase sigma factor (sigma-70 family)
LEDSQILLAFQDPNTRNYAFYQLVEKYQERVYWHIRKMVLSHDDAHDVMQNTFIKVFENLKDFREDASLFTWIYRIATNETLGFLRKKKIRSFLRFSDVQEELWNKASSGLSPDASEIERKLQKALLTLPDKQRLVFNMKYFEDMTYDQMADITGTSVGALKASYHLAVKKIENLLDGD